MKIRLFHIGVILIIISLLMLFCAGCAGSGFFLQMQQNERPSAPTPPPTGWQTTSEGKYFYDDHGNPVIGLFPCPQGTYYFDAAGKMTTGWVDFPEGKRYFTEEGLMHIGYLEQNGKTYCFDREGLMCTGWQDFQDGKFYFDETGALVTPAAGWFSVKEGSWYIQEDGRASYTGWMTTDKARYYFLEDGKMATGVHTIDGIARLFSSDGNYIPLVNPWNKIPAGYEPKLVEIEGHQMDYTAVGALKEMVEAARTAGLTCVLNSSYRTMATQQYLWDKRYNDYISQGYSEDESFRLTARRVAIPGTSEHQTGLAIDIVEIVKDGTLYQWFRDHAWEYGFNVRYLGEKEALTGIKDEPWHLRYVGKEVAQILHERNICLEEYYSELMK